MFHSNSGLFFGRKANGDVRILKLPDRAVAADAWPRADGPTYPEAEMDITLDQHSWCSAIASVSNVGETFDTYDKAKKFHGIQERE